MTTTNWTGTVVHADGVKCPRCQIWGAWVEYDNLCAKCCNVLVTDYPEHPSSIELVSKGYVNSEKEDF